MDRLPDKEGEKAQSPYKAKSSNKVLECLFSTDLSSFPPKLASRVTLFFRALDKKKINIQILKSLSFRGIPEEVDSLQAIIWRILLGELPFDTDKWEETLLKNREAYDAFKEELIIQPNVKKSEKIVEDHPLSTSIDSTWHKYFKDQEIWDEIEKDVKRTRNELNYFFKATDESQNVHSDRLMRQAELKKADLSLDDRLNYIETHADVLARVLFIFAKLNPGIRYVQGMNEILAVLYYCFGRCNNPFLKTTFESDLFFCFTNLMSEIRDGFCRTLDSEKTGIKGRLNDYSMLLKQVDAKVWHHLDKN